MSIKNVNYCFFSDSILHFKEKEDVDNESLEEASKSILSLVTSKTPLSDINKLRLKIVTHYCNQINFIIKIYNFIK